MLLHLEALLDWHGIHPAVVTALTLCGQYEECYVATHVEGVAGPKLSSRAVIVCRLWLLIND